LGQFRGEHVGGWVGWGSYNVGWDVIIHGVGVGLGSYMGLGLDCPGVQIPNYNSYWVGFGGAVGSLGGGDVVCVGGGGWGWLGGMGVGVCGRVVWGWRGVSGVGRARQKKKNKTKNKKKSDRHASSN
jgi:hypothetical protein